MSNVKTRPRENGASSAGFLHANDQAHRRQWIAME